MHGSDKDDPEQTGRNDQVVCSHGEHGEKVLRWPHC
jgi:hypothetical protein